MDSDVPHCSDGRARARAFASRAPRGVLPRAVRVAAARLAAALLLAAGAVPAAIAQSSAFAPVPGPSPAASSSAPVARSGTQRVDAVEVELVADRTAVVPGERLDLGLRIRHDPHWHTYWRNPGDSGLPTRIEPEGPQGTRFGPIRWPAPERLWVGPLANYGYEGEIVLPFAVEVPGELDGPRARFEASAQWLVCKDVCIPGEARVAIELPVSTSNAASARSAVATLFDAAARRTPDASEPIAAAAHRDGPTLSLSFAAPAGSPGIARAEFFPYDEGVISAPAPQSLSRTPQGWRLDLALADGAVVPERVAGLLLADDRALELHAALADGAAPSGTPVSVAAQPAGQSKPGGGLLGGLATGSGSGGAPGVAGGGGTPAVDPSLALALLFGAIGGAILNLMPCVFPVIGLKVIGFAEAAADGRGAARAMRVGAGAFAAGVLVSFWLLAGLMLALRAAGESVGWGFQLQSPGFVAAMALLFVTVGLNFSGVFEFGVAMTRLGGLGGASPWGAFGAGVLAVLVATPCTAPFMGSALGFTLSQPPAWTLAVFTAIGVGMALPYLLLGVFPGWVRRLPRPGRWMQTLRQVLAFPMYATAAWLAWVLVQQAGADALLRLLLAAVVLGAGAWAWGLWANGSPRRIRRATSAVLAAALAIGVLIAPVLDAQPGASVAAPTLPRESGASGGALVWESWSQERVEQAIADGRPVFVDFTAAWCVSCQANKKLVLERGAVVEAMRARGVVALRADWTQRDPAITAALARHGRNGVPLYLVYRPGARQPEVLPELLTVGTVLDALR
jgi:thiol:disulfide interchange protein/DsbC/DsbD-like thiol-disulfide interchange protein